MLQDRKALIESDLLKLKDEAAKRYLKMVTTDFPLNSMRNQTCYDDLRNKISDLEFDLKIINEILEKESK